MATSRAETGSSHTISSGWVASARATPMRWRWPPENWCGKSAACSGRRPTRRNSSETRASRSPGSPTSMRSIGSRTIAPARIRGLSDE